MTLPVRVTGISSSQSSPRQTFRDLRFNFTCSEDSREKPECFATDLQVR